MRHRDAKVQPMTTDSNTRPAAAAASMVGAMAIIGMIDIWVVVIAETISVWQFLLVRMALAIPLILCLSKLGLGVLRPVSLRAVVGRSSLIAFGMFCYFGALAFMPLALALAGMFTSPIFVLLMTAYGLKHSIGPWRILAVGIGFAGILVVLGPSTDMLGWIMVLPVMGGLMYAGGVVATRAYCEAESTLTLLLGIFVAQGTFGGLILLCITGLQPTVGDGGMAFLTRGWIWPMTDALPYVFLQVVGSVFGVSLLNRAYQIGDASHVAIFEYTIMIFGPFAAWLFLGQTVSGTQAMGIALIAASGLIIAIRTRGMSASASDS